MKIEEEICAKMLQFCDWLAETTHDYIVEAAAAEREKSSQPKIPLDWRVVDWLCILWSFGLLMSYVFGRGCLIAGLLAIAFAAFPIGRILRPNKGYADKEEA